MDDDIKIQSNPDLKETFDDKELEGFPLYFKEWQLAETDKERITKDFWDEFECIEKEREEIGLIDRLKKKKEQYSRSDEESEEEDQQFDVHLSASKQAVDTIVNRAMQAYIDAEPRFAFTPRPEYAEEGLTAIEKQTDFVDYALDERIPYREPREMSLRSACKYGNGIIKWKHKIIRENRKRDEKFVGTPKYFINGMPFSKEQTEKIKSEAEANGTTVDVQYKNKGLEDFLKSYPSALEDNKNLVERLHEGKTIYITVDYKETIYDDPYPEFIELENFFVRKNVEGNMGLSQTRLIAERKEYSWWELQKLKKYPEYFNDAIDDMLYKTKKDKEQKQPIKDHKKEKYVVYEAEFMVQEKEGDEDYIKGIFYFSDNLKQMIGAEMYPYYAMATQYNECHIIKANKGFYQPGLLDVVADDQIVMDAIINLLLEALYAHTVITPVVKKGSSQEREFLNRRAIHGLPITTEDGKPLQFFNQYMKPPDIGGSLAMLQYLKQSVEDKYGGTSILTGRESPTDPTAPATKTLALLGEANTNIKVYILSLLPSFNQDARSILSIYYQISKEDRQFNKRSQKVVGKDMFGTITRNEMIARTNVQSQAYNFAVEKMNEKKLDVALVQMLNNEELFRSNPEAVYFAYKELIKTWSPKWKNMIDKIWPSPEEMQQKLIERSIQGAAIYAQNLIQQAKINGTEPTPDARLLIQTIQQLQKATATPPSEEETKEK